ncbi:MAG: hypothetical protein NTU58_03090 [Candidatus Nealsonbacteria bacterium]|nr:hypothetical protein [Candidatus Nealsonbacteria bacterium]
MNKKISTPIAIGIILILAILVGVFTITQFSAIKREKIQTTEITSLSDCDKIQESLYKNECYVSIAVKKIDLSICDEIKEAKDQFLKDDCYSKIAKAKQDLSICDKIIEESSKNVCYVGIAQVKKDPSICEKIQNPKYNIIESCYMVVAKAKQDSSICDKIQDQTYKESCYKQF